MGGLNNLNLSSFDPGGEKFEIKLSAKLVPPEGCKGESIPCPLLAFDSLMHSLACSWYSLCIFTSLSLSVFNCVQISPLCKDAIHIGLRPTLMTYLNLIF